MARTFVTALGRPPAVVIGVIGLLLTVAAFALSLVAGLAVLWIAPLLLTLFCWLALAATQLIPANSKRPASATARRDPYLVRAHERRDALAAELQNLTVAPMRQDVEGMLRRLDRELLPDLAVRVDRHRALERALAEHAQNRGPLVGASPENIAGLRRLLTEQKQALEGLLTELSDMNANLIGLTQQTDQRLYANEAKEWDAKLRNYWQAAAEVFQPAGSFGGPGGGS